MARRSWGTKRGPLAARPGPPAPPPLVVLPRRQTGLRPLAELPPRAKGFLVLAGVALVAFLVFFSIRVLDSYSEALAITFVVLGCIGAGVVGVAVLTATRMFFSLRALPYLLGRVVRRLMLGR